MFGLGMGEIVLIAIVALLFLGPERLPGAAKSIGRTIRGLRSQTRELTENLEHDTELGDAVREIRSALRDEPAPRRRRPPGEHSGGEPERGGEPPALGDDGTASVHGTALEAAPEDEDTHGHDVRGHENASLYAPEDVQDVHAHPGEGEENGESAEDQLPVFEPAQGAVARGSVSAAADDGAEDVAEESEPGGTAAGASKSEPGRA